MKRGDSRKKVLDYIESYIGENQRPPTIREIQNHCQFGSPRAVSYLLEKLEETGLITRQSHSRGIQLTKPRVLGSSLQLPLFASIPAGSPDEFDGADSSEVLRFIPTTLGISNPLRAFAIRVRGDSMIDAGIFSGDIVVLEKKEPKPGDIVAALIDGQTTLKRLIKENGKLFLRAENELYADIMPLEHLESQGVVVSVLRTFSAVSV